MADYSMDELLSQREGVAMSGMAWPKVIADIDREIDLRAEEMADEVERVLNQPDERPFDWETDDE